MNKSFSCDLFPNSLKNYKKWDTVKNKPKLFTSKYLHENYKVNKYLETKIKKKKLNSNYIIN